MTISVEQLVQQIHDAPMQIVLAATGGGSRAIADLLEVPGGSRTLLAAVVPYSAGAMIDFLGSRPDEFCSHRTARAMAMAAFLYARKTQRAASAAGATTTQSVAPGLSSIVQRSAGVTADSSSSAQIADSNIAGVACTAGLATDRPRRGPHRTHIALQTAELTYTWSMELLKDRRSRSEEERVVGRMLLNAVAESCGIGAQLTLDLLEGERIEESRAVAQQPWQDLLLEKVELVTQGKSIGENPAVFSGAFAPLHTGHRRMAQVGAELLKKPVALEITILNPDKPPLDYYEIDRRVKQFGPEYTLLLTRAETFADKARLLPGATFLVGMDTLRRISMDRYYHNDPAACLRSLEYIAQRGCRFLVFGRKMGTRFVRLADLDLPDVLRNICREVPPELFREDISSTGIRKSGAW
jgi:hypothetical protein